MSEAAVDFEFLAPDNRIDEPVAEILELRPPQIDTKTPEQIKKDRLEEIGWFSSTRTTAISHAQNGITPSANMAVAKWCSENLDELLKNLEGPKE